MSVKKVTFEEEDFLQFEAENYDKLTNNYDDRKKNSNTKLKNQKFKPSTNENKGFYKYEFISFIFIFCIQ